MGLRIKSATEYQDFHQQSIENKELFWAKRVELFEWNKRPSKIQSGDFKTGDIKWFEDGELNITVNALDRHAKSNPNKVAIYWEPNDPSEKALSFTYKELLAQVCKFSNVLKDHQIKKGDRVCFYMSMVPELLFGVLACARIGAVHSVVFGGFSAKALAERINDCQAKALITVNEAPRGNKVIPLLEIAQEALKNCTCVEHNFVLKRTEKKLLPGNISLSELLEKADSSCAAQNMKAEDPLFILYTSGSTGKPKGLMHTTAGYMLWASETYKNVFQVDEDDVFWCSADIGWITGHSYITYAPLLNGSTQVMFEGVPTYPDAGRFWQGIDKYKVTHFYTAPTAIRALQACGDTFVEKANLKSLKVLGTVGEPINEEAWQWYHQKVGKNKCPIVDTWWQTETGGIMISSLAGITPSIPCQATLPLPGVKPVLVNNEGQEISSTEAEGNLCIQNAWPGMARTIYGDHDRYLQTYFSTYPGKYFTGDGAKRDEKGNYRITGRVDDVINISGHRIGTAEVEDAINEHEAIVESAVIGFSHEIKGQALFAYVIADENMQKKELLQSVNSLITENIGAIAKLEGLVIVPGLPKTRSGKIMRRILRKIKDKEVSSLGDTSTLLNPEIVEEIIQKMN